MNIYVSILDSNNIILANKVSLKIDPKTDNIQDTAESFLKDYCKTENLVPGYFHCDIFIRDADTFYKLINTYAGTK
jgi:hypothetical protein